jgi:hypothetical protein
VLSGTSLCVGLITRPEESYRLWCVVVCDLENSLMKRPWPTGGGAVEPPPPKKKLTNEAATYVTCISTTSAFSVAQFSGLQTD